MRRDLWIGVIAVFVVWSVLDFILHGILLMPYYTETAALWRPMEEARMSALYLATLVSAACFTAIYLQGFAGGSVQRTLSYGAYFGVGVGFSMGFGTYAVQPIPGMLALWWLVGTLVEALAAALVLHWVHGRFGAATA